MKVPFKAGILNRRLLEMKPVLFLPFSYPTRSFSWTSHFNITVHPVSESESVGLILSCFFSFELCLLTTKSSSRFYCRNLSVLWTHRCPSPGPCTSCTVPSGQLLAFLPSTLRCSHGLPPSSQTCFPPGLHSSRQRYDTFVFVPQCACHVAGNRHGILHGVAGF